MANREGHQAPVRALPSRTSRSKPPLARRIIVRPSRSVVVTSPGLSRAKSGTRGRITAYTRLYHGVRDLMPWSRVMRPSLTSYDEGELLLDELADAHPRQLVGA